jgi:drug/metabolite transporter (DMT)-like permease
VLIAIHWLLFFGAARYSNASVSLIGMSTATLWTSLLEPIFHKRRISFIEILFGTAVIAGLFIIYSGEFSYGIGLLMSLAAAMLAALFSVLNYGFVRKYHPLQITFYEMIGAWIGTIPFLWIMREQGESLLNLPDTSDMVYLLILALVCTVYANTEATRLLKKFSAYASNIVISMEPVYGIVLALFIFGDSEKMDPNFYLGAALLILVVFLYPVVLRKFSRIIR